MQRLARGLCEGRYEIIAPGEKVTQWKNVLKEIMNKNSLIHFIVEQWKMEESRKKIGNRILYVTCQENCYRIDVNGVQPVEDLFCEHEEADTRLLLHV